MASAVITSLTNITALVEGGGEMVNYRNGYFDQSAEIWSADAQLLASTHQLVYYRE